MTVAEHPGVPELSRLCSAQLSVGDRWGPFELHPSAELCARLTGAIDVQASAPAEVPAPDAGADRHTRAAPTGLLPVLSLWALRSALDGIPAGGVLVAQRFAGHGPLVCDLVVQARVWIAEAREGRRGLHTTVGFAFEQQGTLVATAEWTILEPHGG